MSDFPDLSAYPDTVWLATAKDGGFSVLHAPSSMPTPSGPMQDRIDELDKLAELGDGAFLISQDRSVHVPITGRLGAAVARGEFALLTPLMDRANEGRLTVDPDARQKVVAAVLAARDDDFAAIITPGTGSGGYLNAVTAWHDSDGDTLIPGATENEILDLVDLAEDGLDSLFLTRRGGVVEEHWLPAEEAVKAFRAARLELTADAPTPEQAEYRSELAKVPATWPGQVVVSRVDTLDDDWGDEDEDDEDEGGEGSEPEVLASLPAVEAVWVRVSYLDEGEDATDVLLLGPGETRSPDELLAALAEVEQPLGAGERSDDDWDVYVGPPLTGDESESEEPAYVTRWGDGIAFGYPNFNNETVVATDGRNLLVGQYHSVEEYAELGEWVRGQG